MIRIDDHIRKDVLDRLENDGSFNAANVHVAVTNGAVTLSGAVPDYIASRNAAQDAWEAEGVTGVDNQLVVEFEHTDTTDEEIRAVVSNFIAWNPDVDVRDLGVAVRYGHVLLEGAVDSVVHRQRAEEYARDVFGVRSVTNNIVIIPQ